VAGLNLQSIVDRWTHCYHVTATMNLRSICHLGLLLPATTLFRLTNREDLLNGRRTQDVRLQLRGLQVLVRNQIPLDPDSIDVCLPETFESYVACLNERVFFWPGTASGPTEDGVKMFQPTFGVNSAIIRIPSCSLFESNAGTLPHLSTCNTGAVWIMNGEKSRRGGCVFQNLASFEDSPGKIEEISIVGPVNLPDDSEYSPRFGESWRSLFESAMNRPFRDRAGSTRGL
jgi:hypothetical protein